MTRWKEEQRILTPAEKRQVRQLEKERERLFDELAGHPSDSAVVRALNELDIRIVRITGEKTIDY